MANFDTKAALDELVSIQEQVVASQSAGSEGRTLGKAYIATAGKISDDAEELAEKSGDTLDEIFAFAKKLAYYGELRSPVTATVQWKSEEVQAKLEVLKQFEKLGLLTADQTTILNGVASTLTKGSGDRGPRTVAEAIEGKATRIRIDLDGTKEADMAGNKAQSSSNLATRLGSMLGVEDKASDQFKALRQYATNACNGEVQTIPAGDNVITLTPYEPED